ncbi:F0F1 ATP synthase subunit epsilon [Frankia sp. Cppng1_Ct_nod]|uniref:F0F1 ATP synthase subunit epsilon n=1 Tax=Frankia sp. Cppng1_Ct_nod TaxID=2897162 RepID=UPI001041152C|nr:F0F1 ATP synthase subunit epsilon [Frankia sp. Cppng1_Ct_nod]
MPMRVAIVSPEKEVWSGEADMVVARTTEGEIGVQPGHVPLLGVLVTNGEVRVKTGGSTVTVAVDGGFLSVTKQGVSILAEHAVLSAGSAQS